MSELSMSPEVYRRKVQVEAENHPLGDVRIDELAYLQRGNLRELVNALLRVDPFWSPSDRQIVEGKWL